ncbi:MAG: TdeIII family type II restriction endonuclease [Prevotella sp.]|nr:TdeIII family type II restriction endonuclease [Prevotella sp.]MBQ6210880.1 TdeIII family type II restriction endonuclease [Prevotella sp.]
MVGKEKVSEAIRNIVQSMMDKVMDKVLITDPFIEEKHHANKPLYAALVPDEIFKSSHFERRFVTPFGTAWEKLAVEAGALYHGYCVKGATIEGTIGNESLRRIQEVLNTLEHRKKGEQRRKPDWDEELAYILAGGGEPIPASVTCDILIKSERTGLSYAFEFKGPLPDSDQTKVSKEKMFKLLAMNNHPVDKAFFALPYNPYGKRENYDWKFPARWFNMKEDSCVLIGEELWDLIGGKGIYRHFISEINKLGVHYKERIYREFLGIEPPEGYDKNKLR